MCTVAKIITEVQIHLKVTCKSINSNLTALEVYAEWHAFITILILNVIIFSTNACKHFSPTVNCWLFVRVTRGLASGHVKPTVEHQGRLWFDPSGYLKKTSSLQCCSGFYLIRGLEMKDNLGEKKTTIV